MEGDLKQIANLKADVTLITLHVINNLSAQSWPIMLSERAVYT
jgi:hypothetical protein